VSGSVARGVPPVGSRRDGAPGQRGEVRQRTDPRQRGQTGAGVEDAAAESTVTAAGPKPVTSPRKGET
jgi:hypothetical protein